MKYQLCVNDGMGFTDIPISEKLPLIKAAGFDGFFTDTDPGMEIGKLAALAKDLGLIYQSIHAPFDCVHTLWEEGRAGDDYLAMLKKCLKDCADNDIPLMIVHAIIGFDRHTPTALGIARFDSLCTYADDLGVLLGFENTEGQEYLDRIMEELGHHPSCRFCWDTGHEMCYNHSKDMMALYGDRLAGTHINDNLGITGNEITWLDDAHLLPFDGIADWPGIAARLKRARYTGILTFELTRTSKPGRSTHAAYASWDYITFLAQAHARAERLIQLLQ